MSLLLLIACNAGELHLNGEDIELRSAWIFENAIEGHTGILLSNNHLPCELSGEDDPTEVVLDTQALSHAYTREGSVLLWLEIGQEEISAHTSLDITAYYHHVHEAELMWEKGLTSAYRATETQSELLEGELFLEKMTPTHWKGRLELAPDAITGKFRAQVCNSKDLSQILGLYGLN